MLKKLIALAALLALVACTACPALAKSVKTLEVEKFDAAGNVKVALQDQSTDALSLYFHRHLGAITLADSYGIGDRVLALEPGHGAQVGELICLKEDGRYYQGTILVVATNDITLDTPLDYEYTPAGSCSRTSRDMNVDGSSTPVTFHVKPTGVDWDVTEIAFGLQDSTTMDDGKFGGIAAASVPNGMVVRKKDTIYHNLGNIKTNGDFAIRGHRDYADKPPAGTGHAMDAGLTFGRGPGGIVVRLNHADGDELEIMIQDDYTLLDVFHGLVLGHSADPS